MLSGVAVLVFVVSTLGDGSPRLWGSRVVGRPSGPSETMNYKCGFDCAIQIIQNSTSSDLTIENGSCVLNKTQIWGRPCSEDEHYVNITLANVTAQNSMLLIDGYQNRIPTATTFFVPRCKFPRPGRDEVDLNASFPLSRFVKDMSSFTVDFAVGGADSNSMATLAVGGKPTCLWMGTSLLYGGESFCAPMERNESADLRVFHGNFATNTQLLCDSFVFSANTTVLVVSVDYTQNGTSPEVAECNQYRATSSKLFFSYSFDTDGD